MGMGIRGRNRRNRRKKRRWGVSNIRKITVKECRLFRLIRKASRLAYMEVVSPTRKSMFFGEDSWTLTVRLPLVKVKSKGKISQQQFIFANRPHFVISWMVLNQFHPITSCKSLLRSAFCVRWLSQCNTLPKNITIIIVNLFVSFRYKSFLAFSIVKYYCNVSQST